MYLIDLERVAIGPVRSVMLPQPDTIELLDSKRRLEKVYAALGFLPIAASKQEIIELDGYPALIAIEEVYRKCAKR